MNPDYTFRNILIYGIGGRLKRLGYRFYELFFPKFSINGQVIASASAEHNLGVFTESLYESYRQLSFASTDKMFFSVICWTLWEGLSICQKTLFSFIRPTWQ